MLSEKPNHKAIILLFAIIAASSVITSHVVAYLKADAQVEFLADFDACGSLEFENSDLTEDADSFFQKEHWLSIQKPVATVYADPYLLYNHFTPGVINPPPEVA